MIILTHCSDIYILQYIYRYDFLFYYAIAIQLILILFKIETIAEFFIIFIFHFLGMVLEIFKTSETINSWHYPEQATIKIFNVPLFTGFMYSSVGSYISRLWKKFNLNFENFPSLSLMFCLAVLSYINFFSHHYIFDFRYVLLVIIIYFYYKTKVSFIPFYRKTYKVNLLFFLGIIAILLWLIENISTAMNFWVYYNQTEKWQMVNFSIIISWFLLIHFSFVLVYTKTKLKWKKNQTQQRLKQ